MQFQVSSIRQTQPAGTVFSAAGIEFAVAGATVCADQDRFSMTNLRIEIAKESSPDLLRAVTSLLSQLTTSGRAITAAELDAMIASPAATLFLAKDGDKVVGMISLAVVQMPTGLRSYLEDLVVDAPYRQRGAATALLQAARKSAARTMDMTSRPSRTDAIRLYDRLGFKRRDTNPYRYVFE
jgi:ribosomal protein S18 acetylase RimI-like enzyme